MTDQVRKADKKANNNSDKKTDKKTEARAEKYSRAQEIKNTRKMREILDELPRFCRQYFRGIEESTGARTRLAYAYDLRIFFEFIESENSAMKGTAIRDYPVSILEQIGKEDIEEFLEYLTYYEKDGQVFTNDARGKARKLSAVRSMFKYFYTSEILSRDVSALVPLPKLHEKPIIRLNKEEMIRTTKISNLFAVTYGAVPPNPSELLSSSGMQEFVKTVEKDYDYIIFDTPPVGVVVDSLPLVKQSDGVVLVVKHNSTTYPALKKVIDVLNRNGGKIIGIIVNNVESVKTKKFGKGGKGYGYEYGYGYGYY